MTAMVRFYMTKDAVVKEEHHFDVNDPVVYLNHRQTEAEHEGWAHVRRDEDGEANLFYGAHEDEGWYEELIIDIEDDLEEEDG